MDVVEDPPLSFIQTHLGTDMLFASYNLLLSTVLLVILDFYYVFTTPIPEGQTEITNINNFSTCLSGFIYVVSSVYFVKVSYPEEYYKLFLDMSSAQPDDMTFTERYFTGNLMLIFAWFVALGSLLSFEYPIACFLFGTIDLSTFTTYLVLYVVICLPLALWVVSCFPENLIKNGGLGSSILLDMLLPFIKGTSVEPFCRKHLFPDFLGGIWCYALITILYALYAVSAVFALPTSPISYINLVAGLTMCIGMLLFVHTSYAENIGSSISYDFIFFVNREDSDRNRMRVLSGLPPAFLSIMMSMNGSTAADPEKDSYGSIEAEEVKEEIPSSAKMTKTELVPFVARPKQMHPSPVAVGCGANRACIIS